MGTIAKKILITGAAGFLGSFLAKDLVAKGNEVIGIDNLSTGKKNNLAKIQHNPFFTFIEFDISSKEVLDLKILQNIDEVYHFASPASPKSYQRAPLDTILVNSIGTKHMLEITKRNNAKIVYLSTSEVYGDPEEHPQSEKYRGNVNTWGPRACYDESKRLGEVYCYLYYTHYRVKVKVARIFNTYSAGLSNDDGRVVSNFVIQALLGNNITVYGDGTQTRSFCYIDDTIRALKLMMEKEAANGQIMNIGYPEEHSVLEVALLVKKLTNSSSDVVYHPLPVDDPQRRCPSIEKAKSLLGWEPKIDLETGLKMTIEAYRNREVSVEKN